MNDTPFVDALIHQEWTLSLPHFRADRGIIRGKPGWDIWEYERIQNMSKNVGPGDVVYDIGAEEGDMPALWHLWGADVLMVEPTKRSWEIIRAVWEANFDDEPLGCFFGFAGPESDYEGNPPLVWPMDVGDQKLRGDHGFCTLWERPDIPRTTVDQLAATADKPPTILTIDVEGAELEVLKGADFTMREYKPYIYVSVHPDFMFSYDCNVDDFHKFMKGHDYVGHHLATDHEEHWVFWHMETADPEGL